MSKYVIILCFLFIVPFVFSARLPMADGDSGSWGTILNQYLNVSHTENGTLKDNTVNGSMILDGSITSDDILDGTIASSDIQDNSVTSGDIMDNSIIGGDILNTTNLTIGNKITFGLGISLKNLINNILFFEGNLFVNGTTNLSNTNIIGTAAIGSDNTSASGAYSFAVGDNSTATQRNAIAIGEGNIASGFGSIAIGRAIHVSGFNSVGISLADNYVEVATPQVMAIMNGNVGIGEASPGRELVVAGDSNVTGESYAGTRTGGAIDVAEWIKVNGNPEAGDVLVIDQDEDEKVRMSSKPKDKSVAGIVSTKPHMVMGTEYSGDDAIKLALSGRVPVKVTNEGGPIKRGDLLVTSSTPGYAMRCENDCSGAIVAKAMQNFNDEQGKIIALISLG